MTQYAHPTSLTSLTEIRSDFLDFALDCSDELNCNCFDMYRFICGKGMI